MDNKIIEKKEAVTIENKKMGLCCEKFKSKKIIPAIVAVGLFLLMLVSFAIGVSVGIHKAKFSSHFGENYERNFMGPRPDMANPGPMGMIREELGKFEGRGMRNGHGIAGTIISISDSSMVIKDKDNKENAVSVNDKTIINQGQNTIQVGDLKNDEEVIVIGKPGDNGVINAGLIRVFDKAIDNNQNTNQ